MAGSTTSHSDDGASIVLALGGGGARGLAQIGVIEALQARGMNIVAIAGASSGALVGGACAAGKLAELRDWMLGTSRNAMLRLLDPGFGRPALFTGDRLVRTLRDVIGEPRIEDLPIDFTAVAVDLLRQREVWLRRGDLWDAVRASFAIPGIFTPFTRAPGAASPQTRTGWSRWTCTAGRKRRSASPRARMRRPKARAHRASSAAGSSVISATTPMATASPTTASA